MRPKYTIFSYPLEVHTKLKRENTESVWLSMLFEYRKHATSFMPSSIFKLYFKLYSTIKLSGV